MTRFTPLTGLNIMPGPAWNRGKLRPPSEFEEIFLAKPNYSFEKRQREIARKKKQDEKRQRKVRAPDEPPAVDQQTQPPPPEPGSTTP